MEHTTTDRLRTAIPLVAMAGLVSGLGLYLAGRADMTSSA